MHKASMMMQFNKAPYPRLVIAGLVLILFVGAGLASMTVGAPSASDGAGGGNPLDELALPVEAAARVRTKCAECGIVESLREIKQAGEVANPGTSGRAARESRKLIAANSTRRYEVTVRMRDGASRVFVDTNPANWRPGERVAVIEGANQAND